MSFTDGQFDNGERGMLGRKHGTDPCLAWRNDIFPCVAEMMKMSRIEHFRLDIFDNIASRRNGVRPGV
ncbi:hypothetical protein C7C56_014830 [Massilia glaciei]|uniref:Uncharacterized protein n=1 Tax=Massilia glaciei TaxID=1524097 RepID=A0A2U2HJL5_9BURK|nr:hypothetical protein C7C56_014830 [Massilia glaciei]